MKDIKIQIIENKLHNTSYNEEHLAIVKFLSIFLNPIKSQTHIFFITLGKKKNLMRRFHVHAG